MVVILCGLMSPTALSAQTERTPYEDYRTITTRKAMKVEYNGVRPTIADFARAYCKTYPVAVTKALLRVLNTPSLAGTEDGGYMTETDEKNGYLKTKNVRWQFGDEIEMACWRRNDGKMLLGVSFDTNTEGKSWTTADFYLFDPSTNELSPAGYIREKVYQMICDKYKLDLVQRATISISMPQEGEDLVGFFWTGSDERGHSTLFKVKWDGSWFNSVEAGE